MLLEVHTTQVVDSANAGVWPNAVSSWWSLINIRQTLNNLLR